MGSHLQVIVQPLLWSLLVWKLPWCCLPFFSRGLTDSLSLVIILSVLNIVCIPGMRVILMLCSVKASQLAPSADNSWLSICLSGISWSNLGAHSCLFLHQLGSLLWWTCQETPKSFSSYSHYSRCHHHAELSSCHLWLFRWWSNLLYCCPHGGVCRAFKGGCLQDVMDAAGCLQLCAGQCAGCKKAVYAMREIFVNEDTEGILLVDASNTFNSLSCHSVLLCSIYIPH